MQGILPGAGGLILWFLGAWSLWLDYDVNTGNSFTTFTIPGLHWQVGGVFVIVFVTTLIGVIIWAYLRISMPPFFKRQTLTRATPTLVEDKLETRRRAARRVGGPWHSPVISGGLA